MVRGTAQTRMITCFKSADGLLAAGRTCNILIHNRMLIYFVFPKTNNAKFFNGSLPWIDKKELHKMPSVPATCESRFPWDGDQVRHTVCKNITDLRHFQPIFNRSVIVSSAYGYYLRLEAASSAQSDRVLVCASLSGARTRQWLTLSRKLM